MASLKFSNVAFYAIHQFTNNLITHGILIPDDVRTFAISETLFQHGQHIKVHNVNQTSVDPYKIICWFGFSLISTLQINAKLKINPKDVSALEELEKIVMCMISTLEGFLKLDSGGRIVFPIHTRVQLLQLIIEEQKGNSDHGIGKNGLYAAFHCAVKTLECLDNPDSRLTEF